MTKAKKTVREIRAAKETASNRFDIDNLIPGKYQTMAAIGIIIVLFLIFFAPMYFGDKTFQSGDIVTSKSLQPYVEKERDGYTLWNPYIFTGMPAHALAVGAKWFNLIYIAVSYMRKIFTSFFSVQYASWTFYLIILATTSYFLMNYLTRNRLVSLFTALSTAFSTGLIVFLFIGHVTKLTAICMYPLIFLMLLKFQKKIKLLDFAILVIALQVFVQGWHVQIIFYTLFAIGIYFLYYFIYYLLKKEKAANIQLLKSAGVFTVAAIIALLIQADNFTQIYQYTPYSTRGTKSIVEKQAEAENAGKAESDFYEYATNWSFSPGEVMTFIIPSYYGFGNSTYNGPLTNGQDYKVNTYFGQMPFVDVAMYMGAVVFFLALYGIFTCWKNPLVQFLTVLSIIALFISFGRTLPLLYDLMFHYFPFFDKFRVPSMILVLVQLSMPVLAGIGIHKIISLRTERDERAEEILKYGTYIFTAAFVLSLLLSSALRDSFTSRMLEGGKNQQQVDYFRQLSEYASDMFISDALIVFALTALTFWLGFGYIRNKVAKDLFVAALVVFTVFDLWRIDNRGKEYVPYQDISGAFNKPGYISVIEGQKDTSPYRLLNIKQDGSLGSIAQNSNYHMYFLQQDLFGYSGIKPRAYQDILDVLGGYPVSPTLWRMLNVKYIIADSGKPINMPGLVQIADTDKSIVYRNDLALPRAFFVDSVATRPMLEVLNAIKDNTFDPEKVAFIEEGKITADVPDSSAYVKVNSYQDEKIIVEAKATGNNFLFLGDTYYPNGWKATIDGQETEIYRVNHNFRGIIVPKGTHKVEFVYAPVSFYISRTIAFILSSLAIAGLIAGIFLEYRKKRTMSSSPAPVS